MTQITIIISLMLLAFVVLERVKPTFLHLIEEVFIASILATMVLVSFGQVIARYMFFSGWGGALEFTRILFAWLILFGMSYGIRVHAHLGVDAVVSLFPKPIFKGFAIMGAVACVLYGLLLLYSDWLSWFGAPAKGGAMDYWAKMYRARVGLEDLRMPEWVQAAFGVGDRIPRWVAYLMLPLGLALFIFRCLEASLAIWRGDRDMIIASHEAEDLIEKNRGAAGE